MDIDSKLTHIISYIRKIGFCFGNTRNALSAKVEGMQRGPSVATMAEEKASGISNRYGCMFTYY